jgi:PAS domain S-box-containing protein
MIQTIKESKRLQSEQKKELQLIFDYSKDGIFVMDLDSHFLTFNEAYRQMTGYTKAELYKKSCMELTLPSQREVAAKVIKEVIQNKEITNFEKICVVNEGKQLSVNMSMVLLPDQKRILCTVKDMTHIKLLESQSKLVAMGEMIGNIAHQWRQPLSVVSTSASGVKVQKRMGVLSDEELEKSMDLIVSQTQYLSQTIDDFRDFIKKDTHQTKEPIKIKETIEKVLTLIDSSLSNNYITVIKKIEDDGVVLGYQTELIQALINIINNAKDAMKLNISDEEDRFLFVTTQKANGKIKLTITDTGGGVPVKFLDRVFEPYFTTKHQSVGTGIGLYMARDIITNHHKATLEVKNVTFDHEGKKHTGASFCMVFDEVKKDA